MIVKYPVFSLKRYTEYFIELSLIPKRKQLNYDGDKESFGKAFNSVRQYIIGATIIFKYALWVRNYSLSDSNTFSQEHTKTNREGKILQKNIWILGRCISRERSRCSPPSLS